MLTWNEFAKADTQAWKEKATADSKGKFIVEDLVYNVEDDFIVDAFTTSSFSHIPITGIHTQSGMYVDTIDKSASALNKSILQHLQSGVDSLILVVHEDADLHTLLAGIYPDALSITLITDMHIHVLENKVKNYIQEVYPDKASQIHIPVQKRLLLSQDLKFSQRLSSYCDFLNHTNVHEKLALDLTLKQDFLAQIAELRAYRILWNRSGRPSEHLRIVSSPHYGTNQDVHPMIVVNYQMMSAILGNSDVAAIPMVSDSEHVRLSLNLMHIFKEECRLGVVQDPVAGAYLPEILTEKMVEFCSSIQ